ncbi:MAG TPA: hypothetical protein DET40_02325 [Lentisphaeria bacterium]|nr:MAG: hypothetical protein A2X45_16925 [Lentisphaerae bacterium GWF2_50_93]HCE42368.1 hypothetical protein [Lentisphaeria bacterium]
MESKKHVEGFLSKMKDRNYSYATVETYRRPVIFFLAHMRKSRIGRIQDVTEGDIMKYRGHLVERKLSANTVDLYLRSVKLFFRHLEREGIVFINPAEGLQMPKPGRKLQPVPSVGEMEKLISSIDTSTAIGIRDRAMIETAYSTGMRLGELRSLDTGSVDMAQGLVRVLGKGSKERVVPIGKQAVSWIAEYLKKRPSQGAEGDERGAAAFCLHRPPLWVTSSGKGLSRVALQKMLDSRWRKADVHTRISFHAIRRACATHMLRNGAHPVELQLLLGHSEMRTLSHYLRTTITDIKKMHDNTRLGK